MALKVGIQMYSIREPFAKDPIGTIRKVAEIGYKYIELANLNAVTDFGCGFNVPAAELKKTSEENDFTILSAHIDPFDKDNADKVLEYHAELGTKFLASKPATAHMEDVMRACETYNWLGEKCRQYGIQHMFHTGHCGFCEDGEWTLDKIARNTTPENLKFEIDTFWMLRSGFDPCEVIKKYADRAVLIHQKDLAKDFKGVVNLNSLLKPGEQIDHENFNTFLNHEDFCEVGTGQMALQDIIDTTVQYTKATHIILEQDFSRYEQLESIRISMESFKKQKNIIFD